MKLGATITSERGKAITKTGNDFIEVCLNGEKGEILALFKIYAPYKAHSSVDSYIIHWLEITKDGKPTGTVLHGETRREYPKKEIGNLKHGKDESFTRMRPDWVDDGKDDTY